MMKKIFLTIILSTVFVWSVSSSVLAAEIKLGECGLNDAGNEICKLDNPLAKDGEDVVEATTIISTVIKTALGIIGALTLLMLVWGGFQWLTSAGNPEKVKSGTQTMVWAIIGVILVFSSYMLLATFTNLLAGG